MKTSIINDSEVSRLSVAIQSPDAYPADIRKVFPTDDAVKEVVWLAIQAASQKWTMPLRDWRMAMSRFIIEFGDRLDGHY